MEKENELSQAVYVDRSEIDQVRVLTSRTDLESISRFDRESSSNRRNYTPIGRISGVVLESKPDELIVDEQDRLRIVHAVQPNAFEGIAVGSEINLKMEQDDKKLVIVENGASREKTWIESPVPKELLHQMDMEPGDSVKGTLKGVSGNLLEIHSGYSDGVGAISRARYVKLNLNTGFTRADSKEMVGQQITLNRTLDSGKYEILDSHGKDISGISKLRASEPQKTVQPTVNPVDMKKAPVEYVLTNDIDSNKTHKIEPMPSKIGYLVGVDESRFIMKDVDNSHFFALETNHPLEPEIFKKAVGFKVNITLNATGDNIQVDAWEEQGRVFSVEQSLGKAVEKDRTLETEMKTRHVFRLTSRDDLIGYTSFEKESEHKRIKHHGASRVAGLLIDANPYYGTFNVEHPKYGEVEVSVGKRLFLNNKEAVDTLFKACKEKSPVDISLDKTGTALTVAIKDGPVLVNKLSSPAVPYGLVDGKQVFAGDTYRGKLAAVNDEHSVDLQTNKGPLIVWGRGGTASEVTLKKMLGKQVEVSAGKENALVVKSLELEKGLRR